jgi:hypothetical protein
VLVTIRRTSIVELLEQVSKIVDDYHTVLYPHSKFMQNFDNFIAILLLFTTTITPFEIAYLEMSIGPLFVLNRFVDCGFFLDVSPSCLFCMLLPLIDASLLCRFISSSKLPGSTGTMGFG